MENLVVGLIVSGVVMGLGTLAAIYFFLLSTNTLKERIKGIEDWVQQNQQLPERVSVLLESKQDEISIISHLREDAREIASIQERLTEVKKTIESQEEVISDLKKTVEKLKRMSVVGPQWVVEAPPVVEAPAPKKELKGTLLELIDLVKERLEGGLLEGNNEEKKSLPK